MDLSYFVTRLLISLVIIGAIVSVAIAFNKYMLKGDYFVMAWTECDPEAGESCYVYTCDDPEYCEGEDLGSEWNYKIVYKKAYAIPQCDPYSDCEELYCQSDESEDICYVEYCDQSDSESYCTEI